MKECMTIESLPSWIAENQEYPRKNYSQESNYIIITVAAVLITSLVAVLIVNYQKENNKEEV
ncbi:MAG: hypothetical protein ACJA2M_002202 [Polaribacter sp.]|jgi:hypothetical protein|nr:hypothetical protein [Polaribacter sp.]|tara:strand:+ start:41 stop:226 length:186 start_codon:yes stop_codon:yes gene_type:complete